MQRFILIMLLSVVYLLNLPVTLAANDSINTVEVVSRTVEGAPKCLRYQITGLCFWLKCSFIECHVESTLKISQYLPDAVVSVFTQPNNNPWNFAKDIVDPTAYQAGKAEIKHSTHFNLADGASHENSRLDINNKFHEVDIIGNPALVLFDEPDVMLQSTATPYLPYYSSLLDAYAWRFPALERFYPESLIPGLHDVGTFLLHDWGPVFPRNGYVNQPDDAKAAAVNAQRAADIVMKSDQPHIYRALSNSCGNHCDADPVKENSRHVEFQLIYPAVESQCMIFGKSDVGSLQPWGTDYSKTGKNRYIWVLWRHYHGCIQDSGAQYLGAINF